MRWLVIAGAAALVGLLSYGVASQGPDRLLDRAIARGERPVAPDAVLPRLGAAGTASLADFRGKVILLNFWASWCEPCTDELPLIERTHKRMQAKDGVVVGVNLRDAPEDALGFVKRFGLTFPSLRDGSGDFGEDRYGLTGYPETFVIDRRGRLVAKRIGPVDEHWLAQRLDPVLAEEA